MNSPSTSVSLHLTSRILAYLQMMRPANILTAWADILAGCAAAGVLSSATSLPLDWLNPELSIAVLSHGLSIFWLLLSTTGLYGGGVVFNDVFDAQLDAIERPERPIPSGRSSRGEAISLGIALLLMGAIAAAQVSRMSLSLAVGTAIAALLYDSFSKHSSILGPLNMGLCRGLNLLLGISMIPVMVQPSLFLAIIPILYIGAITAVSQGEVSGGKQRTGILALLLMSSVLGIILGLSLLPSYHIWTVLPFALLFAILTLPTFVQATRTPTADCMRNAVKAGILSLIVLDAALAGGFAGGIYGLAVLSLLPISRMLARLFAVT
ncbi:MAG: UbiA-like protein EboC [Cyanothece sp. SIO1E1]|nr:UbiA-like protein EboC [Cyanothece sp. SIO1E1]